jgi:hypothetical protein
MGSPSDREMIAPFREGEATAPPARRQPPLCTWRGTIVAEATEHPISAIVAANGDVVSRSAPTEVAALIAALAIDPRTAGRLVGRQPTPATFLPVRQT